MNDPREFLAPGVSGWSKRERAAKARNAASERKSRDAEAQRKRREFEDALTAHVSKAKAEGRDKDEAYREFVAAHQRGESPNPGAAPPEPENAADEPAPEPDGDSLPDPEDMGREALIAELQEAGEKVHPASKDATLRRKVRELR